MSKRRIIYYKNAVAIKSHNRKVLAGQLPDGKIFIEFSIADGINKPRAFHGHRLGATSTGLNLSNGAVLDLYTVLGKLLTLKTITEEAK
jgi:hypothetical protein